MCSGLCDNAMIIARWTVFITAGPLSP